MSVAPNSLRSRLKSVAGYLCALAVPWLAAMATQRAPLLHSTPLALNFIAVGGIATLFSLGPAVVAVLVTTAVYNYWLVEPAGAFSLAHEQLLRTAVIMAVGFLLVTFGERCRLTLQRLQKTVASLEEQTAALAQAQQGSNSAAWTYDAKTDLTHWYPGGKPIFGRPFDELTAPGSPRNLVLAEDRELFTGAMQNTVATGTPFSVAFRVAWPNGEIHWLEASGVPVSSDNTLWRGVTMDITNRKQTEFALLRAEKLAAAGRLASCIAHELNNPLTAITNLVYLAKVTAENDDSRLYLVSAESELRRLAEISSQTLRFHKQSSDPAVSDMAEVLAELIEFYETRLTQARIAIQLETKGNCGLLCLPTELRQVLSTLMRNAMDAMANGGNLRVRVGPATDWRTGTPAIRITIADTGHGISPDVLRQLYEPFFTTKTDIGAGLGLWVAAGIVDRHNGSLHVRSTTQPAHSGTVFRLVVPRNATVEVLGTVVLEVPVAASH
jgi:PAS domain S-box-containing protein